MRRASLTIEHALLGFLRRGPLHGYALHRTLGDPAGLGPVWQMKLGRLYAFLGKLERAGYVTAATEAQENKPPRKLYELTPAGEGAFLRWVRRPVDHGRALRLEFLIKYYFARQEGDDIAAELLAAQQERCREWLAAQQELLVAAEKEGHYRRLVLQFRLGQLEAMQTWLNQCAEEVS